MSEQRTIDPKCTCLVGNCVVHAGPSFAPHRTSKDELSALRELAEAAMAHDEALVRGLKAQIERLTRQLAVEKRALELAGEVGREAMAERDRLRAAIEKFLSRSRREGNWVGPVNELEAALSGVADRPAVETTAVRCACGAGLSGVHNGELHGETVCGTVTAGSAGETFVGMPYSPVWMPDEPIDDE